MAPCSARRVLQNAALPLVAGILVACAGSPQQSDGPAPVNNGLVNMVEGDTEAQRSLPTAESTPGVEDYADTVDRDMDRILAATRDLSAAPTAPAADTEAPAEGWLTSLSSDPGSALWQAAEHSLATMNDTFLQPALDGAALEAQRQSRTPAEQIAEHVEQIAAILRTRLDGGEMEINTLLALSAMEGVRPGTLEESVDPLELELLRPQDRSALEALRQVVSAPHEVAPSTDDVADRFLDAADLVWEAKPMNIRFATLAQRVLGFGRYEPFDQAAFVAGRPQRMIVYTEIDNFAQRPYRESDADALATGSLGAEWCVELSQELQLYRDGAYVWGKREQTVLEASRNRRRDFYLVHQIELPPTLTVGPYELKIIMRDKTSNEVDEWIIPFRYVADSVAAARAE